MVPVKLPVKLWPGVPNGELNETFNVIVAPFKLAREVELEVMFSAPNVTNEDCPGESETLISFGLEDRATLYEPPTLVTVIVLALNEKLVPMVVAAPPNTALVVPTIGPAYAKQDKMHKVTNVNTIFFILPPWKSLVRLWLIVTRDILPNIY